MAVHDQSYRPYRGELTGARTRFLVLSRYCLREIFRPRLFTALFTSSLALPLACTIFIYVRHNLALLKSLPFQMPPLIVVDASFFAVFLWFQTVLAFLITLVVMPALIAPDLVNGALPLYLCHPLSRRGYVAGKLLTLVGLLSAVTWIPGAALFFLEGWLSESGWAFHHRRLLYGVVAGFAVSIAAMSLPAIAVSVLQRSKARARASLVMIVFVAMAVGSMINEALGTRMGSALIATKLLDSIFLPLLGSSTKPDLPLPAAVAIMMAVCIVALGVIVRRLRAVEVVR